MTRLKHPGAKPKCPRCDGLGLEVTAVGPLLRAMPCTCLTVPCPACRGAGFVAAGEGPLAPRKRCVCQQVAGRGRLFDASMMPGRYAKAKLATFTPGPAQSAAMRMVKEWRPGEPTRGLVLYGDVGRGKTHLAVALLRALILTHGASARFVEFTHLVADLRAGIERGNMNEVLDGLGSVDVLVIDELGKGRTTGMTEFEGTVLDEIVSRRYNAMKAIVATSNYSPKPEGEIDARTGTRVGGLVERIGERVFSRLVETCDFAKLDGADRRQLNDLASMR